MRNEIAISLDSLTKSYKLYSSHRDRVKEAMNPCRRKYHRDFYALQDINLRIKKGETVGIIGENGSGKSTLLKIITGVLTPTSGTVTVNGRVSALLELGAGFNPELTGIENVFFNGTLMGYTRDEMVNRLDAILSFADIGDFVYQPVKTYSSGMFVRLAFAVAVNVEPELLIVDEALSVGDVMFQSKCMDKIRSMIDGDVTTLFVSHDINSINSFCNRVIMLDNGKIYADGLPQVVTLQYYHFIREKEHAAQSSISREDATYKFGEKKLEIQGRGSCFDYRYGTGMVKILSFNLKNKDNEDVTMIRCGERFKLCLSVEFATDIDNPCFGFVLSNVLGQNLLAVNSFIDTDIRFGPQKEGNHLDVEMETTMLLNPGKYLLSFGVAEHRTVEDFTNLDTRKNVSTVEVFGKETACGIIHHLPEFRIQAK